MSDTLTQLIAKVQALLLDNGTLFTTATCTAAIRQALKDFNLRAPSHAADTVEAVTEQYEYELEEITAQQILDVLKQGTDLYADQSTSLGFDAYFEDDRPFFRLRAPEATGSILIVRYTLPYTISGLDSATTSTLPAALDTILLDGAAYWACLIRSVSRTETNNLDDTTTLNYTKLAAIYKQAFDLGLTHASLHHAPVSEPDNRAWNDVWVGQF